MAQFYLLSVLTLLASGLLAASDLLAERVVALEPLRGFAERRGIVLTAGIAAVAVGVFKLFLRAPGDGIPVAGDLLPAIAGVATGVTLVLGQTQRRDEQSDAISQPPTRQLVEYRNPIGLASILVALLHFFFPTAVIL